jgi:hypothetical protein
MFGAHPSVTILTSFHRKKEENIHSSHKEREKWAFVTERKKKKIGIHIYMSYPWATERPGVRASPYLPSRFATERIKDHDPRSMNRYNTQVHI